MPHVIVEYSHNIRQKAEIPVLLRSINAFLVEHGGIFPVGGIRSRAIEVQDYCIADGTNDDDGFVHITVKIGRGRSEEVIKELFDAMFENIKGHFALLYSERGFALSMEIVEFSEAGTWKYNNLHARYKKAS